jgi:cell wall-associated NlpC family hydrolase
MSISAIESRISQIVAMQQQLSDPSALASSLESSATSATSGGASASASSFGDALNSALANAATGASTDSTDSTDPSTLYTDPSTDASLMSSSPSSELSSMLASTGAGTTSGLTGTTDATGLTDATGTLGTLGTLGTTLGTTGLTTTGTSANASQQVQAMTNMANSLIGKPYIYGGGHSGWGEQAGYDCSGFVSAVLHAGGYLSSPQNTQTLPGQPGIESGPGQYVTIYDRNTGPTNNEHVIIEINGQFYESGGMAGSWGGGGGVEKIATPSQSYLSSFTTILHPAGL